MNLEENERYALYCQLISELDEGCRLINEYDAIPHNYGKNIMYQAESQIIHYVGKNPGITANELASTLKKTPSACSQSIAKLRKKGWIVQKRNKENHREYMLDLTESGWAIFQEHDEFQDKCYKRSFQNLENFSEKDFKIYIKIQKELNSMFKLDILDSQICED